MSSATPRPISAGTSAVCSVLQFSPARSPASQVRIASSVCSSRINIAAVTADANPDSATPHNVMRSGVRPAAPGRGQRHHATEQQPAPQAAVSGRPAGKAPKDRPSAEVATTASEAPALSPRICGSPSGLRITVCSSSPATPSARAGQQRRRQPHQTQIDDNPLLKVARIVLQQRLQHRLRGDPAGA